MPGENFPGDRIVSLVDELEADRGSQAAFRQDAQFKVIDATCSSTSSTRSA